MSSRHGIPLFLALLLILTLAAASEETRLERTRRLHQIHLELPALDPDGTLTVSVEAPRNVPDGAVEACFDAGALERLELARHPPGPDGQTRWFTFVLTLPAHELRFEITSPTPFTFARILLGDPPFSPNSRLVGAFSDRNNLAMAKASTLIIRAGEDLLGTLQAVQRVRFPAGFLGVDTEAFDQMVPFGEAPFNDGNNVDSGTTPVRLLRFRNRARSHPPLPQMRQMVPQILRPMGT